MNEDTLVINGPELPMTAAVLTDTVDLSLSSINTDTIRIASDSVSETIVTVEEIRWQDGLEGASIQKTQTGNSGILTVLVILFVALSLNFTDCKKLLTRFAGELFNNKKRENAFDERTNHESRLTILTVIQYIVYGGIILAAIASNRNGTTLGENQTFLQPTKCAGLLAVYYIFQCCVYSTVGYTFGGKESSRKWIRALNASQSLAGFGFILPGLILLFYPTWTMLMLNIACLVYIVARFMFIYKGFCIFYKNIFSLVYFILYLCALEIIPLICVYKLDILIG